MQEFKILIVEDESAILRALTKVFTRERFTVLAAADGERGLALALTEHPMLILFDIIMPEMDGLEMLARIRTEGGEWGGGVKAIAYTNLSYDEMRERARRLDVSNFLIKANTGLAEVVKKVKEEMGIIQSVSAEEEVPLWPPQ